ARARAARAATPDAPPRAILLSAAPRLEALLIAPPVAPPSGATQVPTMIALLRTPPAAGGAARVAAVAALHGLSHSEARLALALCEGTSIAEAAAEIGLTIETARNYSKRLYAKTGARGQADLVRLLLNGGGALA
ncbi:LuxR family transcriptional regulator, partial [Sphingomonas sp. MMSM20]|uniref:helix-turn-helix transcriptional regulator n=1 Tax=Sphingomonas lycopersici TaxID=2951807 RepID=UPI00256CF233|nr:LuxR family transcriptional regulator [Sphingomonas lycopersici]